MWVRMQLFHFKIKKRKKAWRKLKSISAWHEKASPCLHEFSSSGAGEDTVQCLCCALLGTQIGSLFIVHMLIFCFSTYLSSPHNLKIIIMDTGIPFQENSSLLAPSVQIKQDILRLQAEGSEPLMSWAGDSVH